MGLGHQAPVGRVIGQPGRLLGDQLGLAVDLLTGRDGGSGFAEVGEQLEEAHREGGVAGRAAPDLVEAEADQLVERRHDRLQPRDPVVIEAQGAQRVPMGEADERVGTESKRALPRFARRKA